MYFDAVKTIDLCARLKLTIEQFTFCYLNYTHQHSLFIKYVHECGGFNPDSISKLVKRGLVIDINKRGETYCDNYIIQDEFTSNFLDAIDNDLGMELFDNYPDKIVLEDISFNGKNISPEECEHLIKRKILIGRIDSRDDVLNALEDQKEQGQIRMGIKKWIESEQWKNTTSLGNGYGDECI